MYGLRLLSETVPKVTDKVFSRKYTMLGRLVTRWQDIVGPELADKTQPVKIRYMKHKSDKGKATASLDIATSSADATVLHYQKDLILERINQIFGDRWITAIRFVPIAANAPAPKKRPKPTKILTPDEKKHLSAVLESVEDPELQEKLQKLGTAILQDQQS
ncbi:MAG: DUF721 domain-containing protein [Rhodospirillales bacterium]|nr:DUF721 domain-containing protein [Rhodospirillales bacterium]